MGLPLASAPGSTIVSPHQIMLDDSSSFLGWLVGLALLVAAVVFWQISLALLAVAALFGGVVWVGYRWISRSGKVETALENRDYATALRLLQESGNHDALISALRFKIPFPGEELKTRMFEAVRELLILQEAATDPANPHLPAELRAELVRRTRESLSSLWPLCQKLALLARSKPQPEALRDRVSGLLTQLDELAKNAQATRNQVAHLTLGESDLQIHAATEQVGAMKWQVTEMQKINAILEG